MKAVGYRQSLPIDDPASLEDLELPAPTPGAARPAGPGEGDLRQSGRHQGAQRRTPRPADAEVLGWDAVGHGESRSAPDVTLFKPGDRCSTPASITRPGANSELHLVDERIVGVARRRARRHPGRRTAADHDHGLGAAVRPLRVPQGGGEGQTLLIVGGAGGVGSILIQLARQLTQLHVIATASRPETRAWCLALGAHAVIDHAKPLAAELQGRGHRRGRLGRQPDADRRSTTPRSSRA